MPARVRRLYCSSENQHPAWLANTSGYDVNYIKCRVGNYATQKKKKTAKTQKSEDVGGDVNHRLGESSRIDAIGL